MVTSNFHILCSSITELNTFFGAFSKSIKSDSSKVNCFNTFVNMYHNNLNVLNSQVQSYYYIDLQLVSGTNVCFILCSLMSIVDLQKNGQSSQHF